MELGFNSNFFDDIFIFRASVLLEIRDFLIFRAKRLRKAPRAS